MLASVKLTFWLLKNSVKDRVSKKKKKKKVVYILKYGKVGNFSRSTNLRVFLLSIFSPINQEKRGFLVGNFQEFRSFSFSLTSSFSHFLVFMQNPTLKLLTN